MTKSAGSREPKTQTELFPAPSCKCLVGEIWTGESQDDPCTSVGWSWGLLCFFPSSLIHWSLWRVPSFLVIFEGEARLFSCETPENNPMPHDRVTTDHRLARATTI